MPQELYITITAEGLKMGTCEHCVIKEQGRPARAWDNDSDKELDFNRDAYIQAMHALGVAVEVMQEYVCP